MADKGIIFSAPMVRALLAGRKTQTRRLFKPRWGLGPFVNLKEHGDPGASYSGRDNDPQSWGWPYAEDGACDMSLANWPGLSGYAAGDRLYVRETFTVDPNGRESDGSIHGKYFATPGDPQFHLTPPVDWKVPRAALNRGWVTCLHMPRWASRLWLAVTEVRVQRLQVISEADAIGEGLTPAPMANDMRWRPAEDSPWLYDTPQRAYGALWNSLHTGPGTRWEDNPWIVALTFRVNRGNIDRGL